MSMLYSELWTDCQPDTTVLTAGRIFNADKAKTPNVIEISHEEENDINIRIIIESMTAVSMNPDETADQLSVRSLTFPTLFTEVSNLSI